MSTVSPVGQKHTEISAVGVRTRHAADAALSENQAGEKSPATIINHYHPNQMTTGNMAISTTESFIQDLKSNISYEFKTRHHTQRGLYTKAENVRDAIAILRRIQPKTQKP